jgi:hypothetical protein
MLTIIFIINSLNEIFLQLSCNLLKYNILSLKAGSI